MPTMTPAKLFLLLCTLEEFNVGFCMLESQWIGQELVIPRNNKF
jgi:hypothetical protein